MDVRWNPESLGSPRRWLVTGGGGVGKSYWYHSAFWDPLAQAPILIKGRDGEMRPVRAKVITIGQENTAHLGAPETYFQGGGKSFRLKSNNLDSDDWLDDFTTITTAFVVAARNARVKKQEPPLDIIALDGISEGVLLQNRTYENHGNKFATWDNLETMWFSLFQKLDTQELGCHVIMTARPMERETGVMLTDEEGHKYSEKILAPSMRGNFLKSQLSCYFDMAFHLRSEERKLTSGPRAGVMGPGHVLTVMPNGRYDIKNTEEERWLYAKYPDELVNYGFWDVVKMVEELTPQKQEQESPIKGVIKKEVKESVAVEAQPA